MRTVVAVGGSVLAPGLDSGRVRAYADVIEDLHADHRVGVVVGGGGMARRYIGTARELDANEMACDALGIGVTRLNARLLIAALGERAAPTPPEEYETAAATLHRDDVPVMGGVVPGQTTDAVAAALAETVGADLLVYATSVPGVFDADPNADPDATRFDTIAADDLVDLVADIEMTAGASAPIDLLAAKLIQRAGLRTVVLDGSDPGAVRRAVRSDEFDGTEVLP
jgi:uridylate kinase